jgi:hypothetical protein
MKTTARATKRTERAVPRPFEMPWGKGEIVEEATAVGEWGEPSIQLLRYADGSESIRFCQYDHRGRFRRSPLMVDAKLVRALGRSLASTPRLKKLLRPLT